MAFIIKHKPIHLGKYIWKRKSDYAFNNTVYLEYCLSTGYSLVYFIVRENLDLQGEYFFFQYAKDENTTEARFIGTIEDFKFIEIDYMDMDSMLLFDYYYSSTKAIIKPDFGLAEFYYYISRELIIDSEENLIGYFNRHESAILNLLYNK